MGAAVADPQARKRDSCCQVHSKPISVAYTDADVNSEVLLTGIPFPALWHNSGRVTDRSESCLKAIEFALTQAGPDLPYDSAPHI